MLERLSDCSGNRGSDQSGGRILEDMGHYVEETVLTGIEYQPYFDALLAYRCSFIGAACDQIAAVLGRSVKEHLEPLTFELYKRASETSSAALISALAPVSRVCQCVGQFFQNYDLLLTPTTAKLPVRLGTIRFDREVSLEEHSRLDYSSCPSLDLFNVTGQPAISLPAGQSQDDLPIGVQFVARFGEEELLLQVASAFEQASPWKDRKPPIHVSKPQS